MTPRAALPALLSLAVAAVPLGLGPAGVTAPTPGSATPAGETPPLRARAPDPAALPDRAADASARPAPRDRHRWPLRPVPRVTRAFEPPPQRWLAGHRGVDLAGRPGQQVLASAAGTVRFSGVVAGRGVVTVQHPGGLRTTYEPVTSRASIGSAVRAGSRIGTLSSGGSHCAPAACLHWGALTGPEVYLDPLTLLGAGRVILLPLDTR